MSIPASIKIKNKALPNEPGVYLMKNNSGEVIYVGRATSLKKRVGSYFTKAHDGKTELLVRAIASIDYIVTDSVLEATFLEPELIKQYQPKYNIDLKDDKSFIYLIITKDQYPRVLLIRGQKLEKNSSQSYKAVFGPFMSAHLLKSLLKLVRRMIPYSNCKPNTGKPCFYYQLGQCPGVCIGEMNHQDYKKIIRNLILFFRGDKKRVISNLRKKMEQYARVQKFEKAAHIRNQLYNLEHIQDTVLIKRDDSVQKLLFNRIEGYDVSNISGTNAVGSMVVFIHGEPDKSAYRKFRIKTVKGANDVAMIKEILERRLKNNWPLPELILIDGGKGQVNVAQMVLKRFGLSIPLVGIAKGPTRKKVELVYPHEPMGKIKIEQIKDLLVALRDEAHRFALSYHRKLRRKL